ncbi:hypothetical protein F66182_10045 [Fusarium sp. NRRL 66182]|nr:hypothetical protein F66182_10045 [Fusarium sp. NRRL 66182]
MPLEGRDDARQRPEPSTASPKRRINGRACITCHQRKVRCDILEKGVPCSHCETQSKSSSCRIYEKKKTRSSRTATRSNIPLQPRQQCLTAPATPNATGFWTEDAVADPIVRPSSSMDNRLGLQDSADNDNDNDNEDGHETSNLANMIGQLPKVGEISRSERLYFIGNEFSNLNYLVRHRALRDDQKDVSHFGSRILARKVPSVPEEALQLPPKALADELISAYFVHVNRGFPIVDEDEFMARYNGSDVPVSLPLLNAIFLVGAHVLSSTREDCRASTYVFFRRAKMLFDYRFEQHRETYLQVALLLTWQCDNLEDVVSNSWHWVGVASRTAFGMGMHRDASSSTLNTMEKRQWVRLWWCVFQFDVMISASFGRPLAINLDESDTPMLQGHHFQGIPHGNPTFAIEHTRLCMIFSKAMRRRVALRASAADRAEATKQADQELAEFITHLPQSLRLSHPEPDTWQAILHLSYNNFLIILHRPPPHQDPTQFSPDAAADLSICSDAVDAISSIFESLRTRNTLCDLWLPAVHVLFTCLLQVASGLNSINPLVAAKSSRTFDSLLLTLRDISHYWIYAKSLLRLFEERAVWNKRQRSRPQGSAQGPGEQAAARQSNGSAEFSLRPNPLNSHGGIHNQIGDAGATSLQPSPAHIPGGPAYGFNFDFGGAIGSQHTDDSQDVRQQGIPYGQGFVENGLDMAGDDDEAMNFLPVPSVLEFLLAGVDNQYDF